MKTHYTAAELAGMPGVPGTHSAVVRMAKREAWRWRKRAGRGGGREYAFDDLPEATRRHLMRAAAAEIAHRAPETLPAPASLPTMAELSDWQREQLHARLAILSVIDEMAAEMSLRQAVGHFIALAETGELRAETMTALDVAKNASHGRGPINRATIYRWQQLRRRGVTALAPRPRRPRSGPKPWLSQLLALYQRPQKPSIAWCVRQWRKHYPDIDGPTNAKAAERALAALPAEIREYGRMGRNARRAIQPFVRRSSEGLWPMDVVTVDGHLFKAYVRHPMTGRPFRPEVTTYCDIATRRIVGFSAWLAESQYAIWCALREMVLDPDCGIPALHYSDNGAYRGEQHRATLERIGTSIMFSQAYRAQARGVIERLNSSLWVPLAKEMPVYAGQDMDKEAFKRAMQVANDTGVNLPGWPEFLQACRDAIADYNDRPHAALSGATPNQAWAEAVADGWRPTLLEADDLHDLLPTLERRVIRGEVRLPWGRYSSPDLARHHGRMVRVAYEPTHGERVWISDERGVLLCTAERGANVQPYVNQMEHYRAQRAQGRIQRAERRLEQIHEEAATQIDYRPAEVDPIAQAELARLIESEERAAVHGRLEDDPRHRHAEWIRVRERIERGEETDGAIRQQCEIYWRSQSAASQQAMFDEFGLTEADFPAPEAVERQSAAQ